LQDLLSDAVRLRTIADVPTGVFLSGRVDSSSIVALMRRENEFPVRTFTIGMEDQKWDEAGHARRVARHLETNHAEDYLTDRQTFSLVGRMPDIFDEPFADSSQLPTLFISEFSRRDVTVALSGDGGDELFCGYGRYCKVAPSTPSEPARIDEYRDQVSRFAEPSDPMPGTREPRTIWDDPSCWLKTDDFRNQTMFLDSQQYLPDDLLVKVDRTAMANSLETRMPFLDHRMVEFVWNLPPRLKVRDGQQKWILRQVLYRHVPRELIERPKMGFSVSLDRRLRNGFRDWAEELLGESRLRREGYFDPGPIRRTWGEDLSGQCDRKHALWLILMFQASLERQRSSLGDSN
jgi:asparagine synthase (glutamine-hydrolysing)